MGLQRHTDLLEAAEVDMDTLHLLTDQDLQVSMCCCTAACSCCSAQRRELQIPGSHPQPLAGVYKLGCGSDAA